MQSVPFQFYMPIIDLQKTDSGQMRIGGFSSSEAKDRQGEDVIQKGLDFSEFVTDGWFNVNHSQDITADGLIGVPLQDGAKWLQKGDPKPVTNEPSERDGWYVVGELLDTKEGRSIFEKAKALEKLNIGRHLGMSLEGEVLDRDGSRIKKAKVKKIAITERPVSFGTTVEVLTKAFMGEGPLVVDGPSVELQILGRIEKSLEGLQKALTAGSATAAPAEAPPGDGFALRQEDLDGKVRPTLKASDEGDEGYVKASDEGEGQSGDDPMAASMGHDGITGSMPELDAYYMKKAEPPASPDGGLWTPETARPVIEERYPHLPKERREKLLDHMFTHLGGR